jgi:hypothetical protein
VSEQSVSVRRRWVVGSLPGPSRTITVEPIQVPAAPRIPPALPPERREPDPGRELRPDREPVPAR